MNAQPPRIAVFAKAPVAGQVKTRLMPALGGDGAARLHAELVEHTLTIACAAGLGPVTLWCAPTIEHPFFSSMAERFGVECRLQTGADLGARMHHAFAHHCASAPLLLVGTDCPALVPETLRRAAAQLQDHDAVFVPAEDGGYVMIGLNQAERSVFQNIPWGGHEVMARTRVLLRQASIHWRELELHWDLDRPEDLPRFHALRAGAALRIP